ncbi:hypothetical protein F53441_1949 [Fusarium austroafricanum]|uniref:BTB domain-containing protein n=1 Tax=Fusarium austroafricanum TaxID=2364996 RepID=A0A8H4KT74_9HYPO|nr:hypothetical protein F53441_1949 [Fusarium austroafricanum]
MEILGKPNAKTGRGMQVKREKHQGTSFINATTFPTNIRTLDGSRISISGIKFVSRKRLSGRVPPKPVTKSDLKAVQEGSHKRIAPKPQPPRHGKHASGETSIPYQHAADIPSNVSFSFGLTKTWSLANDMQNYYLPSPNGMTVPDWSLHGLPREISDQGKQCFHAYLFSCPIRQHPLEQLQIVKWQPLSMDQSRFQRLMLQPLTLQCTLSMGALFLLLKSQKVQPAGISMHSARLCGLVNKLLSENRALDEAIILIQSIASLTLLAAFLGLYNDWYAHVKGLKHMVDLTGGLESLPLPVQMLVEKVDLAGACDIGAQPLIVSNISRQTISKALPLCQRTSLAHAMQCALYGNEGDDGICDAMQSLVIFAETVKYASSQGGKVVFDPLELMEEYHSIEYKLVALPEPIQSHVEALEQCLSINPACDSAAQSPESDSDLAKRWIQVTIRLTALFYLKKVRPGDTIPEDFSGGYDPHEIFLRDKAEKLLRILGRSGWNKLDECIADNIQGLMKPSPFTFDPRADTLLILRNPNAHLHEENEAQVDSEPEYERLDEAGLAETKTRRDSPMTLDNDQSYPRGSLDDGSSTQVEFRVSSRHLSLASPFFRAMLESRFKESQPNDQGLYEVQASDWDAEAFVILLDIIHGHHRDVPKRISVETLSHIAIIVDYYGCHEIMELVFAAWISYLGPPEDFVNHDPLRWLFISWVFRQEALFTIATRMLLLYDNGKYVVDLPIPQPILDKIDDNRQFVLNTLFGHLYNFQQDLLEGKAGCSETCASMLLGSLMKQMRTRGLTAIKPTMPFDGWRVEDARSLILGLAAPPWRVPGRSTDHPCTLNKSLSPRVNQVLAHAKGLELKDFEGSPSAIFQSMTS